MKEYNKEYIKFALGYRRLSIVLSSAAFIAVSSMGNHSPLILVWISLLMLFVCFLGEFLYRFSFLRNSLRIKLAVFTMLAEIVLYGLVLANTGGYYSPYLWHCIGVLPIMLVFKRKLPMFLSAIVSLACSTYGFLLFDDIQYALQCLVLNIIIGISLFFLAFINIKIFIMQITKDNVNLQRLNEQLMKKSDLSDMAISSTAQARDVLETFGEQNAETSLQRVLTLYKKLTGTDVCILVKFDTYYEVEHVVFDGLSEEELCEFLPSVIEFAQRKTDGEFLSLGGYNYRSIKSGLSSLAVVVYPENKEHKADLSSGADRFCVDFTKLIMTFIDNRVKLEDSMIQEEKRRIAEEMHDTILQKIFVVTCMINSIRKHLIDSPHNEQEARLKEMETLLHTIMQELRDTIYDVRSADEMNDLRVRIHKYVETLKYATDASFIINVDEVATKEMDESYTNSLYRVICEAINNAVRHANATEILVSITCQNERIIIYVNDNGEGYDYKKEVNTSGGVKNMASLVHVLNGTLTVKSEKTKGTSIKITIPNN